MRKHKIIIVIAYIAIFLTVCMIGYIKQKEYKDTVPEYYVYYCKQGGYVSMPVEFRLYTEDLKYYISLRDVNYDEVLWTYELTKDQYLKCIPSFDELEEASMDTEYDTIGCGSYHYKVVIKYFGKDEVFYDYGNRKKAGEFEDKIRDVLDTVEEYNAKKHR